MTRATFPFLNNQYVPQIQSREGVVDDLAIHACAEAECCDVGVIHCVAAAGSLTGQHNPAASEVLGQVCDIVGCVPSLCIFLRSL